VIVRDDFVHDEKGKTKLAEFSAIINTFLYLFMRNEENDGSSKKLHGKCCQNSFRWALLHINIKNCSLSNVIMVYIVVQNLVEIDAVVSIT